MGAFGDLFKSPKQRALEEAEKKAAAEKDRRRAKTRAKMKAENALAENSDRIARMEKENAANWEKAREYLKAGRKSAAQMELGKYRAVGNLIDQIRKKTWIMEFYLTRLEGADSDSALSSSIGEIASLVDVDPIKLQDNLETTQTVLADQTEIDRLFDQCFSKEMRTSMSQESETCPSVDELMRELEAEAAHEVGGTIRSSEPAATNAAGAASNPVDQEIRAGREALRNMLDENDKQNRG